MYKILTTFRKYGIIKKFRKGDIACTRAPSLFLKICKFLYIGLIFYTKHDIQEKYEKRLCSGFTFVYFVTFVVKYRFI